MGELDEARISDLFAHHLTVTRRRMIGLLGASLLVASCGRSNATTIGTASGNASTPGSPFAAASNQGGGVAEIGGSHVPANQALSVVDAERVAGEANGHWQGGWHDSAGRSGNTDAIIDINANARSARATLAFSGSLLGSGVGAQAYEIDLLSFLLSADTYSIVSPQFGSVTVTPGGSSSASAAAKNIPGHPEIASLDISASRFAQRVDLTYTTRNTNGETVTGTMAWTSSGPRGVPAVLPSAGAAPNLAEIQSGAYAAGLLTGSQLTAIFGSPFPDPESNGGRLFYDTGIDTSNAECQSHTEALSYTIYVGDTAAHMATFWSQQGAGQFLNIPGSWKAAFWYPVISTLYVYATDTRAFIVKVTPLTVSAPPTSAQLSALQHLCEQVATQLVTAFS